MHKGMRVWDFPIDCNLGNPSVVIPWKKNDSLCPSTCQLPVTPYLRMKPWEFMPHPRGTFDWLDLEQVTQWQFLPEYSSILCPKEHFPALLFILGAYISSPSSTMFSEPWGGDTDIAVGAEHWKHLFSAFYLVVTHLLTTTHHRKLLAYVESSTDLWHKHKFLESSFDIMSLYHSNGSSQLPRFWLICLTGFMSWFSFFVVVVSERSRKGKKVERIWDIGKDKEHDNKLVTRFI